MFGQVAVLLSALVLLNVAHLSKTSPDSRFRRNSRKFDGYEERTDESSDEGEGREAESDVYTNEWAAYIPGGHEVASAVARELGYENMGQIGSLDGYYLLRHQSLPRRSKRGGSLTRHTRKLLQDERVEWVEQQYHKLRVKRDLIDKRDEAIAYQELNYDDDLWSKQWYLFDSRTMNNLPKLDLHVIPVWAKNFTGDGVVVTVLDDGLEHNHTDLLANYDPKASYDFNGKDDDPFPRYDPTNENKHGTRCAGEIAMMANNRKCGVGVAYNARIGGIRILDGTVTDSLEARALSHNIQYIDIFSASWGPSDDGATLEKPGRLASAALEKGIREGRRGKGTIYVWASGNGGFRSDNCDCDGYTGSIYTLSISSASQQSKSPWYAEHCASTMATTYSSGAFSDQKITSTDLHDKCTTTHTGTSASAPLAAGIFALILQVNPELTWRDLQHLVAWTCEYAPLQENTGWRQNGAGYWVSERFGFGLLNAAALANAADKTLFKTVPSKSICSQVADASSELPAAMRSGTKLLVMTTTDGCKGEENEVNHLEHVIVTLDMSYSRRGNLRIYLTSPAGTETVLLTKRPNDKSELGFDFWPFMSVQNWGEHPAGTWTLRIADDTNGNDRGVVKSVRMTFHGTRDIPDHVARAGGKRSYNFEYNNIHNTRKSYDEPDLLESTQEEIPDINVADLVAGFQLPAEQPSDDYTLEDYMAFGRKSSIH